MYQLAKYFLSYKEYCITPSILCCSESKMIIDGHHRFNTLKELGVKKIPVNLKKVIHLKVLYRLRYSKIRQC